MNETTVQKILNPLEMAGFIRSNGTQCQFISLLTVTSPKLRKDCPYKGVQKFSRRNGLLNMNYNRGVQKRIAEKLGVSMNSVEYVNGETWFIHFKDEETGKTLPLVHNKNKDDGKVYVQYFPLKSHGTKYFDENGIEIEEEKLEPYFYARSEKPDWKPVTCVFDLNNVKEMTARKIVAQTEEATEVDEILAGIS